MKQVYLLCICISLINAVSGQNLSLSTLIDYSNLPYPKFQTAISKKGFRQTDEDNKNGISAKRYQWFKKGELKYPHDYVDFCNNNDQNFVCLETADKGLADKYQNELRQAFHYPAQKDKLPLLYQRENIRVRVSSAPVDSVVVYRFEFERKELPKLKDLVFAEDLLKITSHEYLITLFGESNVMKDVFFFSEKELNRCSILFPNTNREVVFVWKDEENYSDISFLTIGGHIQTKNTMHFDDQIEQNAWRSSQGIYTGMSLYELQDLNGGEIQFYGWHLDFAGAVMPHTQGKINFDRIGCILNCLNCANSANYQNKIVKSDEALADDRKIYVTTMIILPEKKSLSKR